ncbi:MAG: hypothetical protein LBB83_10180, partial [Treponema sp.]|jgi:hypothetical protein|nr:hypothetical protein [Treponema sp.]
MWFCGALYMEIAVNRFLGNSAALAKYENWLKTVCDKNNVTRAEVESFYRQNIGALIAAAVDAEFGKVSRFMIDRKYNAVLTRNPQNGQYELSYTGVENATKKLSASTLEALSSAMSKSGDFSATAFNVVREQAALIPAVVLAEIGTADTFLGTVKKALADFYLSPTTANYNIVKDISALFTRRAREYNQDTFFWMVSSSYDSVLSELSLPLASKVFSDMNQEKYTALTLTQAQIRALTVQR